MTTKKKAAPRAPKSLDLRCDAVDVKPIDIDWTARPAPGNDGERAWTSYEANRCETCNKLVVLEIGEGDERHRDLVNGDGDLDDEQPSMCPGHVPLAEGPMMNYFYPLGHDMDSSKALKLADLPVCLVELDGECGLALTGGGMDLSWEICEAYIALGLLPPVHFCNLPAMSGRGTSVKDQLTVHACKESLRIMGNWMRDRADRLDAMVAWAKKEKRARARRSA
jgi:hypothetical protein